MKSLYKKVLAILIIVTAFTYFCEANSALPENDDYQLAEELFLQGNIDSALFYYLKLETQFRNNNENENLISVLIRKAELYLYTSKLIKATEILIEAEELNSLKQPQNKLQLADIYKTRGSTFLYQNNFKQSAIYLNKSLSIRNNLNLKPDKNFAVIYNELASNYYFLGEYDKTINYFEDALKLNKKLNNTGGQVTNLNNIGALYQAIGQYQQSINYIQRAMEMDLVAGNKTHIPIYLNNIGNNYQKLGQYNKALVFFNRTLEIDLQSSNPEQIATDYNNIAWIQMQYKNYNSAIEQFQMAADLFKKAKNKNSYAKCLDNLGDLYRKTEDFAKAEKLLTEANKIFIETEHKKNEAVNWNNQGLLYLSIGKIQKAISCHNKAIAINKKLGVPQGITSNYNNLGKLYQSENDYKTALQYFQKAIILLVNNFDNEDVFSNPEIENLPLEKELLDALKSKAEVFSLISLLSQENTKSLQSSLDNYCLSVELINKMRISYYSQDKLNLSRNESQTFETAISIAYQLHKITGDKRYLEKAFKVTEMSKAAYLYELIRENEAKLYSNIPDSLLLLEKVLKSDIFELERKIINEKSILGNNDSTVIALNKELFEKKFHQFEKLKTYFDNNYPKYYELKYNNEILDIQSVQQLITNNDAFIEYTIVSDNLFIFVIIKDTVVFTKTEINEEFYESINIIKSLQSEMFQSHEIFKQFAEHSYNIYSKVLKDVEYMWKGKDLIIIPNGILGYIPFETLLTNKTDPEKTYYKDSPYLLKNHAISYAYSATLLYNAFESVKKIQPKNNLLAIAPSFNMNDNLPAFLTERGEEFVDLIGSKIEVNSIYKIFSGEKYLDSVATESNFKNFGADFRILHIATHGIIDDEDPMNSRLLFYRNNDSIQDGDLYTYELFNMQLKADLAVLSACNTGCGKLEKGEGIISLARGFLYAGVPSVVMTLWSVPDGTSVFIVEKFYAYLKEGYKKNVALQKAKLDYLENSDNLKANPYFWAGFVNIGNTDPLSIANKDYTYFYWLGGFILLMIFFFIKRKKGCFFKE